MNYEKEPVLTYFYCEIFVCLKSIIIERNTGGSTSYVYQWMQNIILVNTCIFYRK